MFHVGMLLKVCTVSGLGDNLGFSKFFLAVLANLPKYLKHTCSTIGTIQITHLTCSTFGRVLVGHICQHDLTIHQSDECNLPCVRKIRQISNICLLERNFGKPQMFFKF